MRLVAKRIRISNLIKNESYETLNSLVENLVMLYDATHRQNISTNTFVYFHEPLYIRQVRKDSRSIQNCLHRVRVKLVRFPTKRE